MRFLFIILNLFLYGIAAAQAPVVQSFTPNIGGQSSSIYISGQNFTNTTQVSFGGMPAALFYIVSDTSIVAFVDTGSSGAVTVTSNSGSGSLPGFTFIPAPVISSIGPDTAAYGDTVRIRGFYFTAVAAVYFGDTAALSFTVSGDTLITAVVGNGASGLVMVNTVGGIGVITGFTYAGPVISSFTPATGSSGTEVTIRGKRFTGATAVSFGGFDAASFTVVSDTLIRATVGNGGPGQVRVITPRGTAIANGFIVPYISSFDPQSGTRGTIVSIRGINFTGINTVQFGDSAAASFTVVSDSLIVANVGNGNSGSLYISNSTYSDTKDYFFYFIYQPLISSFSPTAAPAGTTITIRGTRFTGTTAVQFGNTAAASFQVVSDSVITAIVGNGSTGYVYVTNNNITDSMAGFMYIAQQITALCPPAATTSLNSQATGSNYQWQLSTNDGQSFNNLSNGLNYTGVNSATLQLLNIPSSFYGYQYRCLVNGVAGNRFVVRFVNTWTGAVNTFWNNTGNWSCNILPDANTDVVINNGTVLVNTSAATCRSLSAAPGTNVNITANMRLSITH